MVITQVTQTRITFALLMSWHRLQQQAAGGALLGSTGRMLCVRKARYAMESTLGLFASMRRTNSPELPTADEMTVTDGEHRKVTGGGKGGAM